MRILLISRPYYPILNPRSFRWTAICEKWTKKGIQVDVVCGRHHTEHLIFEKINGVNVYRVSDPSEKFRQNKETVKTGCSKPKKTNRVKTIFHKWMKELTIAIRWPDSSWLWIIPAYFRSRQLLKNNKYDAVVSVAHPFSSHVVALLLNKKKADATWLCDYGDPFSFLTDTPVNNTKIYDRLNKFIEKKVIQASRKISVTTIETAKEYEKALKVDLNWFRVIPPLFKFDQKKIAAKSRMNTVADGREINLVFAGNLYSKIRNPSFLLKMLAKANQKNSVLEIKIHFYGDINDCEESFKPYEEGINDWIFLHGKIDKNQLMNVYQEKAGVLVNIGNATSYQVPSKVVEYMAIGLPILNIVSIPDDLSVTMLKEYPVTHNVWEKKEILEEDINALLYFFSTHDLVDVDTLETIMKPYQPECIAVDYLNMIRQPKSE